MGGVELPDFLVDGQRGRDVPEGQVPIEGFAIEMKLEHARPRERLDLRSEEHVLAVSGVKKRFDAQPVAAKNQTLAPFVPQGEREHPAETRDEPLAQVFIEMDDHFDVAAGLEDMARGLELAAQFLVVV